jgi:hypothetical protein
MGYHAIKYEQQRKWINSYGKRVTGKKIESRKEKKEKHKRISQTKKTQNRTPHTLGISRNHGRKHQHCGGKLIQTPDDFRVEQYRHTMRIRNMVAQLHRET